MREPRELGGRADGSRGGESYLRSHPKIPFTPSAGAWRLSIDSLSSLKSSIRLQMPECRIEEGLGVDPFGQWEASSRCGIDFARRLNVEPVCRKQYARAGCYGHTLFIGAVCGNFAPLEFSVKIRFCDGLEFNHLGRVGIISTEKVQLDVTPLTNFELEAARHSFSV